MTIWKGIVSIFLKLNIPLCLICNAWFPNALQYINEDNRTQWPSVENWWSGRRPGTYLQFCPNNSVIYRDFVKLCDCVSLLKRFTDNIHNYIFKDTMTPCIWGHIKKQKILCKCKGTCSDFLKFFLYYTVNNARISESYLQSK